MMINGSLNLINARTLSSLINEPLVLIIAAFSL